MPPTLDVDDWMTSRGIKPKDGRALVRQVKIQYPNLSRAVRLHKDVEGELELIQLIYDVRRDRFPVKRDA